VWLRLLARQPFRNMLRKRQAMQWPGWLTGNVAAVVDRMLNQLGRDFNQSFAEGCVAGRGPQPWAGESNAYPQQLQKHCGKL